MVIEFEPRLRMLGSNMTAEGLHLFHTRERLIWASFHCIVGSLLFTLTLCGYLLKNSMICANPELRSYMAHLEAGRPFDLEEATLAVYNGTSHTTPRFIQVHENWVQWIGGKIHAPLRRTQHTALLINGQIAECSERAQILKTIAEKHGHLCRFVGLGGHVVLEVAMDHVWHVADPEFGLTFPVSITKLSDQNREASIIEALRRRNIHEEQISNYLHILQSEKDNTRLRIGEAISPRLELIENISGWLTWLIPLACYISALGYFISARSGTCSASL